MHLTDVRGPSGTSVDISRSELAGGTRVDVRLRNDGRAPVELHEVHFEVACAPERVLEQGFQSWSPVRRARVGDRCRQRLDHPDWVGSLVRAHPFALHHADRAEQVMVTDVGVVGFVDGRPHFSVLMPTRNGVTATALLDGVPLEPGEERALAPLWFRPGDPGAGWSAYAQAWSAVQGARADTAAPRLGWCSWYHRFRDVTADDMLRAAATGARHDVDLIALDDGYATIGDWLSPREAFPQGTAAVAAGIAAHGQRPGIWTAPFVAVPDSRLLQDNPSWAARDRSGRPLVALEDEHWGGVAHGVDISREDVLDHLGEVFGTLAAQGWTWHKLDFVYGGALPGAVRRDPRRTRAQVLHRALRTIRSAVGEDAFLLGCGAPLGPCAGVVDAMRVSGDTGVTWTPQEPRGGWTDLGPAARTALTATALRAPYHRRVWINDPDCLLLRPTALTAAQREAALAVAVGAGGLLLLSDDLCAYGSAEWDDVARVRAAASLVDGPLDVVDPFAERVEVRSARTALEVDWASGGALATGPKDVLLGAPDGAPASRLARLP